MPNRLKALLITLWIEGWIWLVIFLGIKFPNVVPYVILWIFWLFMTVLMFVAILDELEW